MARTSRAERHGRRESSLALVSQGKGFSEVVQIPIKNGSTFSLPNYRAAKDSTKEGSELLEIRFDWGLGGMMQFPSQTVNLRINDEIKGNSKKNNDESACNYISLIDIKLRQSTKSPTSTHQLTP